MLEVEIKDHVQQRQRPKERQGDIFEHRKGAPQSDPGWGNAPPHYILNVWPFSEHGWTITGDHALA
jgi:hypothetical protein